MPDAASGISAERTLAARYRLVRRIDRGGMAEVWEGRDEVLDRPVAVKVLDPRLAGDEAFHERFRREAVSAARLAHPNVVGTYDTGIDGGVAFIVMELVSGQTLRDLLRDQGPLNPSQAAAMAAALQHVHAEPMRPRQLRPGIPRSLERIVLKAMSKDPAGRYATAAELRRDLLAVNLSDDATVAVDHDRTPPGGVAPTFVQSERSWLVPVVLIVVLAVTLGAVGLIFARSDTGKSLLATGGSPTPGQAATIRSAQAFDP